MNLESVNFKYWWVGATIGGIVISIAAITAKENNYLLLGIGIFLFGLGEWINHPICSTIQPYMNGILTNKGPVRMNKIFGVLLSFLGIVLFCISVYKLIVS